MVKLRIGVLALQGSVTEHLKMLEFFPDVESVEVKSKADLQAIDGIILPGGESTAIGKLLRYFDLFDLLKSRIENGLPVWGTCAGMILLAKEIADETPHLCVMDIKVRRNAYGRQINSFSRKTILQEISKKPIDLVFIRAPWIEEVKGNVEILGILDGHIIAARQNNMLVTSFHPELSDDLTVHRYFLSIINGAKR